MGSYVSGYTSPAAAAREVFKPSADSARLTVPSQKKKKNSVLGLGFSWGASRFYGLLYSALEVHRMGPHFVPSIILENRLSYEFLEPLIGLLAYLDQKLCNKNQK